MARLKIDYGIDLGTTNSAIAVMDEGKIKMHRTDTQRDTMPSCVMVTKKGFLLGDKAYAQLSKDKKKVFTALDFKSNIFIEFKRTMGNSVKYKTDDKIGIELSSEELSAEVLKTLKSYIDNESVKSAIITIPAAFEMNQINATKKAAELAGIEYVELVQEPYAAAIAYGVESANKNGFWLVFDFGGGTFDSALVKVSDGIIKVIDTEGNNFLGGKNLDEAIVDHIFLPYLKEHFSIDSIIENQEKLTAFKEMWKPLAEDAKNQLSYKEKYPILTNLYDEYGEDDEGEEFEIDLTITREQLKEVIEPFIQKAIDYSKDLIKRNNLDGNSLGELILVGGPTLSPIVREMLEAQIKKPNTSVDPMTVVAKGAAIYASTINNTIEDENVDASKVQLHIDYDSMVASDETFVTIRTKEEDRVVFAEIARGDDAFKSERVELNNIGEVIELHLKSGERNNFSILLYDEKGNKLECEPHSFSIQPDTALGGATLTHTVCIEVFDKKANKQILKAIKGLEKDKTLPAQGVFNGLTTRKQIRPGMDDFIDIPIYQGIPETKAISNNHVTTVRITGDDLPKLLPEGSIADLTLNFTKGSDFTGKINFIDIDFEMPLEISSNESEVTKDWLEQQISETERSLRNIDSPRSSEFEEKLNKVKSIFENKNTEAGRLETRSELQKLAREIEQVEKLNEWPNLEEVLKEEFYRLEKANNDLGNENTTQVVNQFRSQLDEVIRAKDIKLGNVLLEEISGFFVQLTLIYQLVGFIRNHNENFASFHWKDSSKARTLLNKGMQIISENPTTDELHPIVISVIDCLEEVDKPGENVFGV
ncbi:Hsp70 family protein [Salegentibacter salarius]|uniref:Heat-shock protein Hsp70 n=1 Tax=Salegentibacter salarius TaxID=435906 RepID=A0A2N0TX09_9FLAO|nr:Hsp70 family protein [Salegentibacter salarius]OEY72827.1 heat-shock protein Hsp70 [Salegentibacter salarius]PKD19287.1 heat-shock protein Hsp70 [Salegentibacter salarius]SLK00023.1 molecular chaperone DnaK [Salegentibacter salarius]